MFIKITAFSKSNDNHVAPQRLFRKNFQIKNNKPLPSVYVIEPEGELEERKNHSWPKNSNNVKVEMEQIP